MIPTGELYKLSDHMITYIIISKQRVSLYNVWIWSCDGSHDLSVSWIMTPSIISIYMNHDQYTSINKNNQENNSPAHLTFHFMSKASLSGVKGMFTGDPTTTITFLSFKRECNSPGIILMALNSKIEWECHDLLCAGLSYIALKDNINNYLDVNQSLYQK